MSLRAQHTDGGAWLYAGVSHEVIKDLKLELGEELRYNISTEDAYQINTHFSAAYKLTKQFKIGADYRYSVRDGANTNRYGASITFKEGFNDLDVSLRTRLLYSVVADAAEGTAWRNKLGLDYKINKEFSAGASGELFYAISNEIDQFDNYRLQGGLTYSPNKHHSFDVAYVYDHEFNVNNPHTMHILSIGYVYDF
jgi:long-subunit fatty acid transport protein